MKSSWLPFTISHLLICFQHFWFQWKLSWHRMPFSYPAFLCWDCPHFSSMQGWSNKNGNYVSPKEGERMAQNRSQVFILVFKPLIMGSKPCTKHSMIQLDWNKISQIPGQERSASCKKKIHLFEGTAGSFQTSSYCTTPNDNNKSWL